ncbi:transposase [Saccharopolyspora sp. WRP15-2]|uniref:Transposase n=1 Tax=Saccharopolyspora oryzae TaxID=2997343 RepID=A0ABT4VAA2_9PSEU|nr:transposase [Saccharopolyspora oryzae]MDA3630883.1 transposase [Saccharopolyspora oryzae]
MKIVVQVKLQPTPEQESALDATLRAANQAANEVSQRAFKTGKRNRKALQGLAYGWLKSEGFSAQPALHIIRKVADSYTILKANIDAGNLGRKGAKRRVRAESKPTAFRAVSAQPFDDRCLSWNYNARTVSIWTTAGRMKNVRFGCASNDLKTLMQHRKGESDLMFRDGKWFLIATCEVPEEPQFEPVDWIGVDRGINNLATTSDSVNYSGRRLGRYRRWQARKRAEIQAKRTRSAARLLKKRAKREARHAGHMNHTIAKDVVAVAQRTERGIALEELGGIRERVTVRRDQRATQSSWPFHQLGSFIAYKAQRAGVPVIEVDAAYTSQHCPLCGHTERANRPTRDDFRCRRCGLAGPADVVAGINVRDRARSAWVFVNMPQPTS